MRAMSASILLFLEVIPSLWRIKLSKSTVPMSEEHPPSIEPVIDDTVASGMLSE
jgi:hypothetical protein